jgi:hypothetical protein
LVGRYRKIQIFLATLFISHLALAQAADEMTTRRTLIDQARKASNASDYAQALSLAVRAAEIRMTSSLRLFIAQQQSMVGQLENSIANAELCAFEATEDKALKNRKAILGTCKDLAVDLQKTAARIIISWPEPVPPHAQLLIGGQVVPESFYGRPYAVSPGYVRIEASAPGRIRFQREVQVQAQEEITLTLALPEEPGAPQAVERVAGGEATVVAVQSLPPSPSREVAVVSSGSESQSPRLVGAYVVLGAGAASLGASAVFLILRNNAFNKLEAQCGGPNRSFCTDTADARSLRSKASTYNDLTDLALGLGSAAVVGGAIWLFYERARGARTPRQAEIQIKPIQGGAVVGIGGTL